MADNIQRRNRGGSRGGNQSNDIQTPSSLDTGFRPTLNQKPIALDTFDQPVQDLGAIQQEIAKNSALAPTDLALQAIATSQEQPEVQEQPQVVPIEKEQTLRELMEQRIRGDFDNINQPTQSALAEKALKESLEIDQQTSTVNTLTNEIRANELANIQARDEILSNPSSMTRGGVNAQVNELNRKFSAKRANNLLGLSIARGDLIASEKVITDRVSELNDQAKREDELFDRMFEFSQDTMSDAEELKIKQQHDINMQNRTLSNSKELASYKQQRDASTPKDFSPSERKTLIELATAGDSQSIADLGYDPNQLPAAQQARLRENEALLTSATQKAASIDRVFSDGEAIKGITGLAQGKFFTALGAFKPGLGGAQNLALTPQRIQNIDDARSTLSFIVNDTTFQKLVDLKSSGATFGALSDSERSAIGKAANEFNASVVTDEAGNVTGFTGSEKKFRANLGLVLEGYHTQIDILNSELLSTEDQNEINNI